MRTETCSICGRPRDEHHSFSPIRTPQGCKCDPHEWGDPTRIPPVCGSFVPMDNDANLCDSCEHEQRCHESTP